MKVIYFIASIVKTTCLILLFSSCNAYSQPEAEQDDWFCYEVYDYVLESKYNYSLEKNTFKKDSFELLLILENALKHWPLFVKFRAGQVIFYFQEPCSETMVGFPEMIDHHNRIFEGKLILVPSQNYRRKDIECVLAEEHQPSCPGGHLKLNSKDRKRLEIR
jgi:hypothetical protein